MIVSGVFLILLLSFFQRFYTKKSSHKEEVERRRVCRVPKFIIYTSIQSRKDPENRSIHFTIFCLTLSKMNTAAPTQIQPPSQTQKPVKSSASTYICGCTFFLF